MSYTCIVNFVDLASIKGYVLLGCIRFFVPLPDHYDRLDRWTFFSNRSNVERVGPRILSLESVDYLGTSEHLSGREKKEES